MNKIKLSEFIGRQLSRLKAGQSYYMMFMATLTAVGVLKWALPELDFWWLIGLCFTALICAFIFGYIINLTVRIPEVTSEMRIRTFPIYLDIIIAICAGLAVGFCVSGGIKSSMVGAAIALSLMPPAVNVGLALVHGNLILALGSLILLLLNVAIINICTIIVLKIKKVHALPKVKGFWQGPIETKRRKKKLLGRFRKKK